MTPMGDAWFALISVTMMVALALAIAWSDFDRLRHALTWALAFALLSVVWILAFLTARSPDRNVGSMLAILGLSGVAVVLNTIGFHQRVESAVPRMAMAAALIAQVLATLLLLSLGAPTSIAGLPLNILVATMAWSAARTLVGRRKGERAAERLAQYCLWLLALVGVVLAATSILSLGGWAAAPSARLFDGFLPLLPATITGLGLFTVFLLTADLADQSRRLAGTDMLTGLLNRRGFGDAAASLLASARRNGRKASLAMIDIDRFKEVNDRFGHLAGDEVLRRFSTCLARLLAPRDILARVGGEEFALLLADTDGAAALASADRLRRGVAACELHLSDGYRVTASFGVVEIGEAGDLEMLVAKADRALYEAKSGGRDRVVMAR